MSNELGKNATFWSELIRVTQVNPSGTAKLYTLSLRYRDSEHREIDLTESNSITLDVHKQEVAIDLNDDQLNDAILMALLKFPDFEIDPKTKPYATDKVKNQIARNTRRGVGNTQFEDYIWYQGSRELNTPDATAVFDGAFGILWDGFKYGLFIHPDFEKYGYRVVTIA